jgi:thiol-disulfide isomerase/thioredoxin
LRAVVASLVLEVATADRLLADERRLEAPPRAALLGFVLSDLQNGTVDLGQYAGRVVLVHFFATWCEPCRAELASLTQLLDQHRDSKLIILGVNVAEGPTRVERFLETAPVNFPVLLDSDRTVSRAWDVSVLPTTFVLDRALAPRLWVEGDLDWSRPDVRAVLDRMTNESE